MGNLRRATDFRPTTSTTKASFKETFAEVVDVMPTTYVFDKGGSTNVTKDHITKAIDTFASVACTGHCFSEAGGGAWGMDES
jgi:hypothetical protein